MHGQHLYIYSFIYKAYIYSFIYKFIYYVFFTTIIKEKESINFRRSLCGCGHRRNLREKIKDTNDINTVHMYTI